MLVFVVFILIFNRWILLFAAIVVFRPDTFFICGEEFLLISDSFLRDLDKTIEVLLINYFEATFEVTPFFF